MVSPHIILLGLLSLAARAKGECCPVRVISGLGDVYTLKVEVADKPEEICVDGCVYTRSNASNAGEEYCFKNQQSEGSLVCQDTGASASEATAQQAALEQENTRLEAEVAEAEQQQ